MAEVIPFPTSRRVDLVERTARAMASMSVHDADLHMLRLTENEFERQRQAGIGIERIEDDLIEFSSCVRRALWHEILSRPGCRK